MIRNVALDLIKNRYKIYINNREYVYRMSDNYHNDDWIIIMKKIRTTLTNESKSGVVDRSYAKFRANVLKVVAIVNVNGVDALDRIVCQHIDDSNKYHLPMIENIIYRVGETVNADYFDTIEYFNTIEPAFYNRSVPKKWTGVWYHWNQFGRLIDRTTFKNGIMDGKITVWYDNGVKMYEGYCDNGYRSGYWVYYHPDGAMRYDEFI